MKRMMILLAMALVMLSNSAFAATTANLSVSATVVGSCSIAGGTLGFGNIDNFQNIDATASTSVDVTCGNGIGYVLSDDGGLGADNAMDAGLGGAPLAYSLAYTATGTGTGAAVGVTIDGTVAVADLQAAVADSYTDTVVLTISPAP